MARFGRSFPMQRTVIINRKSGWDYRVVLSETVSLVETVTKTIVKAPIVDSISLSEVVTATKLIFVNVADAITLNETLTKITTKVLSETVSLVESLTHKKIVAVTDSITLSEVLTTTKLHLVSIFEQITLVEKVISFLNNVLVSPFTDLYKKQSTSNSDLYDAQNTQYNDPDLYH